MGCEAGDAGDREPSLSRVDGQIIHQHPNMPLSHAMRIGQGSMMDSMKDGDPAYLTCSQRFGALVRYVGGDAEHSTSWEDSSGGLCSSLEVSKDLYVMHPGALHRCACMALM